MKLKKVLEQYHIEDADHKAALLEKYMELVLDRNQHVNLTAITDRDEFIQKHYADSLACSCLKEFQEAETVLDLGTGGGFPGIPLAICYPEKKFTLLDSLNKRIQIIQEFCDALRIGNVKPIHGRAEDLGRDKKMREHYDVCVSRAVADLRVLSEYCLPFVKQGGYFIAYKSADCAAEVKGAEHAVTLLGGGFERIEPVVSDGENGQEHPAEHAEVRPAEHCLVVIWKKDQTPAAYPRKAGTPGKKPL